jgi:hypothetical protein
VKFFINLIFLFCIVQATVFGYDKVYLASFPRSGNHWVRFLAEEATHIATGSVYRDKDFPHLPQPFPWGGYCTNHGYEGTCRYPRRSDPVLVKTHYPFLPKNLDLEYKCAICLIRHPIDAFWSFHVYKKGKEATRIDHEALKEFIKSWKEFYQFWTKQPNVLFVRYEDLHADTSYYLNLILQKAGFSFNQIDVERAVNKYLPQGELLKHKGHYSDEDIQMIEIELADILMRFNYESL